MRLGNSRARILQYFFESPSAQVAVNHIRSFVRFRRDGALHLGIHHAGREEEVGQTVVIEIDDARAPTDEARLHSQAGAERDIAEVSSSIVAVEDRGVIAKVSFENVETAVGIEIA